VNFTSVMERSAAQLTAPSDTGASAVARAALQGLSAQPKFLPSWLFYDAAGSQLFEAITRLPEYYLTSSEHAIFSRHAEEMIAATAGILDEQPLSVVELGAGSASKTIVLLRALIARQERALYMPVDISEAALRWASKNVRSALPTIDVQPICSEITNENSLDLPEEGRRLALYIGSSIGNFDPPDAADLLLWLRTQLQPGDALLLGTDMVKNAAPLLAAYNDAAGITAQFNKNVLARLNRELQANFDLMSFDHRAIWNAHASRMEMHLDSKCDQLVHMQALERSFAFRRGESIHTENSYKFQPDTVEDLLMRGGFQLERSWYDEHRWFGVHLARAIGSQRMLDDEDEAA
jgi:L-histidine Nalpha-methyltransferase